MPLSVHHISFLRILAVAAAILFGSQAAIAENRVALVIGQSAYQTVTALPNPANDARQMSQLLSAAGFEVMSVADLSQNALRQAIGDFAAKVASKGPDTVALVFYAGHGLQIDGENFLVPIDVNFQREADVPLQAVRLNDLMNTLASVPTKMRIVMLDACRNDPFEAINKTAGRGLAMFDPKANAAGSFVSYATSPGAEAEDGAGTSSPYTNALVVSAREPGLPIEEAFKRVRLAVNKATEGRQIPWESSSLTSEFFFFPVQGKAAPKPTGTRPVAKWRQDLQGKPPEVAYDLVVADDSLEGYEAFVGLYPQSPFAPRLRSVLERRREMVDWSIAVNTNTAAAYRAFLFSYPNSDLALTARKLQERQINRSLNASAAAGPANLAGASGPGGGSPNQAGQSPAPTLAGLPSNAGISGPTCPCGPAPKLQKAAPPPKERIVVRPPPRGPRPPPEEIIVRRPPPRDHDAEAAAAIGGAIGGALLGGALSGGFGGGGGYRGGGGMHHPR